MKKGGGTCLVLKEENLHLRKLHGWIFFWAQGTVHIRVVFSGEILKNHLNEVMPSILKMSCQIFIDSFQASFWRSNFPIYSWNFFYEINHFSKFMAKQHMEGPDWQMVCYQVAYCMILMKEFLNLFVLKLMCVCLLLFFFSK